MSSDNAFMSGDFETATDFMEHDISRELCKKYLRSAGILG